MMANLRPKRPNPPGMLFYPLDRDIIVMLNKKLRGEDLLHDNINDPPMDLYSASPADLLGNAAPNNVLKKEHVVYTSHKPIFNSNGMLTGYDWIVSNIGEWRVYGSPHDVYDEQGKRIGFYTYLMYLENQAHTKERKATSWRMSELSSLKSPISFYPICTVWCETPAYTNALQLNHEIVCALDPAYDAVQTIMDMINSGNVKGEDDELDTVASWHKGVMYL
ncbi:NAC domain-containing protein 90-like protein [Tanacetum coccineum]